MFAFANKDGGMGCLENDQKKRGKTNSIGSNNETNKIQNMKIDPEMSIFARGKKMSAKAFQKYDLKLLCRLLNFALYH